MTMMNMAFGDVHESCDVCTMIPAETQSCWVAPPLYAVPKDSGFSHWVTRGLFLG